MKERMRLEKMNKTGNQSEPCLGKKRKEAGNNKEKESKKKKRQKEKSGKENLEKAKEKEDRKKKKEEEKERQDFLLETRKSQAAARWAFDQQRQSEATTAVAEKNSTSVGEFSPLPLRSQNSTTTPQTTTQIDLSALSPSTPTCQRELQKASSSLSSTKGNKSLPMSRNPHSATVRQSPTLSTCIMSEETPGRLCNKEKTNCDTRRGLHFQSSAVESSSEDEDVPVQDNPEVPHGNCCRKQRLDNEALTNRLQKLGRRLEIACKRFYVFLINSQFQCCCDLTRLVATIILSCNPSPIIHNRSALNICILSTWHVYTAT